MKRDQRRALTPKEIAYARSLRRGGWGWTDIARRIHCSYELIRRACDPEYAAHRNRTISASRSRDGSGNPNRFHVPPEVFAERERRSQPPRSTTALLCGDPPPGYSALDQKNSVNAK